MDNNPIRHGPPPAQGPAIEDYAVIGNCRSIAHVSRWGSIDWWCHPNFSSPSVFGALLDAERGGRFELCARDIVSTDQRYRGENAIVRTRFECRGGVLELLDFMPMPELTGDPKAQDRPQQQRIVRIAHCVSGSVELDIRFEPRPHFAQQPAQLTAHSPQLWHCEAPELRLELASTAPLQQAGAHALGACVRMAAGDTQVLELRAPPPAGETPVETLRARATDLLTGTEAWWRAWCSRCKYKGDDAHNVLRSAITLKLCAYVATGGVVAAATTSLPETMEGGRNWDYRYCWLRDSSLVLDAFSDIGFEGEAADFMHWLLHATRSTWPDLQVVYGLHGETYLPEKKVESLRGWRGVPPVHVGNGAFQQVQNDVYGEVMFSAWDFVHHGGSLSDEEKRTLASFAETVCRVWRKPDHGLWEIRLPPRHNTQSKILCWVALDRALALHELQQLPIEVSRLKHERDAIREDVEAHGFDRKLGSYVGYYGSTEPDASLLLIPRMGYLPPDDPRMLGTTRYIMDKLSENGLLYRYPPGGSYDGVKKPEHPFAICSFWLVDCLARQGLVDEAQRVYDRVVRLRNHVGLFSEEYKAEDGSPMGNFPQAFSQVGLITAAGSLYEARNHIPRRKL